MHERDEAAVHPFATVAICTYNRSDWLKGTLRFACFQDYPSDRWEVLVVDNASTDSTHAVASSFSSAPKPPRYLLEKRQGLSFARNRALEEARGDIVVFLDDDTEGKTDWLRRLMEPYGRDSAARIGVVGGEIVPGFPDGLPSWLEGQWEPLEYRQDTGPLPPNRLPMGANFSVRRSAALQAGFFRTDLGRKGEVLAGSEDHDFIRRVRSAGFEVWFVPDAAVVHLIPGNRLTFRYAMRHAFDSSRSRVIEKAAKAGRGGAWLASRMVLYTFHAFFCTLGALLCFAVLASGRGKRLFTRASRAAGYVVEAWRQVGRRLRPARSGA